VLEAEVLAALWASEVPLSAEEVRRQIGSDLAYTTVTTILTRLHEKGAVTREPSGRGYAYRPLLDQAGLTANRMRALLEHQSDRTGVLSRFVAALDATALAELRRLLGGAGRP
jgi:predicted transcriptional regulator